MSTNNLAVPSYQNLGKPSPMRPGEIIGRNVVKFRELKGWSTAKLAREIGVALNTVQRIEAGDTVKSKYLPDIARILGKSLGDIDPSQVSNETSPAIIPRRDLITGERDLPIYGTTEAGDGVMVMSSEPVDKEDRPPSLTHVRDAYGVIVVGDSMHPIVRPGDIVVVHPHKQPRREDLCVFRVQDHGEFRSTVKEFVSSTADGWRVRRYHPETKELVLKKRDWPECHVVVTIHRR